MTLARSSILSKRWSSRRLFDNSLCARVGGTHAAQLARRDSFTRTFRPISLEHPKVLLPLANVPMIEYTLVRYALLLRRWKPALTRAKIH